MTQTNQHADPPIFASPSLLRPRLQRGLRGIFGALIVAFWFSSVFSTARADDFTFVQISDTHLNGAETPESPAGKMHVQLREIAALKPTPAFIVDTGDITENGTAAQFASFQRAVAAELPASLPLYTAPGNHDVRWNPPAGDVFLQESGQPRFRSWDYGGVHFVLLDSTVPLEHWGHIDQAQLDYLTQDLKRVGPTRPVIIGCHHWAGRAGSLMMDNEDAFLNVVAPYNVRLLLFGHGHANVLWNVNGIPAIMTGAFFNGSYSIIHISDNKLEIFRRTLKDLTPAKPFFTEELTRPASPQLAASAVATDGAIKITLLKGDLPTETTVTSLLDGGKPVAIAADPSGGWSGSLPLSARIPGIHRVLVLAKLPDGRVYRAPILLQLSGEHAIAPIWSVNLSGAVQGNAFCDGGTVYVPTMGGILYALDAKTGATRWQFTTGGCLFGAPMRIGETLYFGSGDGNVYAINRKSAKIVWKATFGAPALSGLAVAGKTLCAALADGRIFGIDSSNGKTMWSARGEGMFQSRPATDGTHFFLGDWGNSFRCLDAATGAQVWKIKIGRSFYYSPAIGAPTMNADASAVFVTSDDGLLHSLDARTGVENWKVHGPMFGYSGPLFADGRIYNATLTDAGDIFCVDPATGAKLWDGKTDSVIYDSSCCAAGPNICVGCVDGTLSALNASNGALVWQYRLGPGDLLASPISDGERIYIGNLSGKFFAFPIAAPAN